MSNLGRRVKEVRSELGLNQGDTALLFDMKQPDFAKVESGTTKNKFVDQLANFILKKNIPPEKLYYMITGKHYKEEENLITELPKMFVIQTKNHIKSLENQIEELKHQRDFLEILVKDTMINRSQQETTSPETQRQTGTEIVGKKLKRPETADP
jgi:hypothetical protein